MQPPSTSFKTPAGFLQRRRSLLTPPYRGGYVLVAGADLRLNDLTGAVATAALPPSDEPVAIRYPCESAFALTNKR